MGFAVEDTYQPVELTKAEWSTLNDLLNPPEIGLGERSRRLKSGDLPLRYLRSLHQQWIGYADRIPDAGRALIISHGGYLDDSAIACLPDENHDAWGAYFERCEGILLGYDEGKFRSWELLRLSWGRRSFVIPILAHGSA